jgi:hypothetical protein
MVYSNTEKKITIERFSFEVFRRNKRIEGVLDGHLLGQRWPVE